MLKWISSPGSFRAAAKQTVVMPMTNIFPRIITKSVTWFTKNPRTMLLVMRWKASCDDFQKPVPTIAVITKAFLLMYLITFSRKKKHPRKHQIIALATLLLAVALCILSLRYSTLSRASWATARMNDPQATVPRWYLRLRLKLVLGHKLMPLEKFIFVIFWKWKVNKTNKLHQFLRMFVGRSVSFLKVQYQLATAPAIVISPSPETTPTDQRKMKMLYHCRTRCQVLGPYLWNTQADSGQVEQFENVCGWQESQELYTSPPGFVQFSSCGQTCKGVKC